MSDWDNQAISLIILTEEVTGFSGLFGYSPAPGAGNLILSVAARAGTDPWGDDYPQGISSKFNVFSGGTISGAKFEGTNFEIDANGERYYSATPAAGNLLWSIGQSAYTDDYGNAVLPGVVKYSYSGSDGPIALQWSELADSVHEPAFTVYTAASYAGPWTAQAGLYFDTAGAAIITGGLAVDGALNATGGTPAAPTLITTDSWHGLGSSGLGLTGVYRYRLTPDNEIEIDIRGTINAKTGGTASWANPVSPVPATATDGIWPVAMNTSDSQGRIYLTSAGIVEMTGFGTNVTNIGVTQRIPLD